MYGYTNGRKRAHRITLSKKRGKTLSSACFGFRPLHSDLFPRCPTPHTHAHTHARTHRQEEQRASRRRPTRTQSHTKSPAVLMGFGRSRDYDVRVTKVSMSHGRFQKCIQRNRVRARKDPEKIAGAACAQHQPLPKPGRSAVAARRAGARRGEYARNRYVHLYLHFADSHLKYRALREVCDLFLLCARAPGPPRGELRAAESIAL